jgi:Uma2 family endonuclease
MQLTSSLRSPQAEADYFYPSSDGRPVGETPAHVRNLLLLVDVLEDWFASDPMVYVAGNMFLYYEQRNRLKHVSPDVLFVHGVPKDKPRKSYFLWEEGKPPDLVIELTSASTRDEDLVGKKSLYQNILGVHEYFLFDPYAEYLDPPLQGFRLQDGTYADIPLIDGRLASEALGLHFEGCGEYLRLYNPASGRWVLTGRELAAETAVRLDQVSAEKERLERELAELQRRLGHTKDT